MTSKLRNLDRHTRRKVIDARFSEAPSDEMIEYVSKMRTHQTKYAFPQELWNHKAHTLMLYEQGILTRNDASKILSVLDEIDHLGVDKFPLDPHQEELFFNIESYMVKKIGEDSANRMHTGRSRADMYVTVERMVMRERILQIINELILLIETLINVSKKHVTTIMPGYSLLQHAQPITFAHYLISFIDRFQRDLQRLQGAYTRVNMSPMGAAINSGSGFPVSRPRVAELLGFDTVIENTRDAAMSRDFSLETMTQTAVMLSNLTALADDLIVWSTYEFGMIVLSDAYSGTSSIMPQKKNPSALTRVRHFSAECIGNTMTVFAQLKTHSDQLNDFEATGPVIWRSLDTTIGALKLMKGVLATLKVNKDIMYQKAGANFIQATQLAETLVKEKKLPFRIAHHIVARLVKNCIDQKISPAEMTPGMLDHAAIEVTGRSLKLSVETVKESMDVKYIIENRETLGGPGRKQVTRMLKRRSMSLQRDKDWLFRHQNKIALARNKTYDLMRRLLR